MPDNCECKNLNNSDFVLPLTGIVIEHFKQKNIEIYLNNEPLKKQNKKT